MAQNSTVPSRYRGRTRVGIERERLLPDDPRRWWPQLTGMTLDFDRYLLAAETGLDSLLIRRAYRQWTGYCYAGPGGRSGVDSATESYSRPLGADLRMEVSADPGLVGGGGERCSVLGASDINIESERSSLPRPEGGQSTKVRCRHSGRKRQQCSHADHQRSSDRHRNGELFPVCVNMGENRSGPRRPTGSEFGKRLAWLRDDVRKRIADNRVLPVQRGPALGLSGLRCQGNLNSARISTTTIRRIATEAFPKCATSGLLRSTSNAHTLCNGHLSATMGITSHVFTTKRSAITSRVTLAAINDVIEEEESVSSDSSDDTLMTSEPEVATSRSRKVTFADEHGEHLVRCRVFERDQSPVAFIITQSLIDSDTTDEGSQESEDETDMTSFDNGKRFSMLADDAYKHLNRDIDNLKKLIEKHRQYLDSLRPVSPTESALIARSQDEVSRSGDLVEGVLPVTDANDNDIQCRFVNFYFADDDNDAVVKLKQIYFDRHEGVISGKVAAQKLPEKTELFVRYTKDDWRTQDDVMGNVITASRDDADEFDFRLRLSDASHVSNENALRMVTMEMAICYRTLDLRQEFWDNNGGQNYRLEVDV